MVRRTELALDFEEIERSEATSKPQCRAGTWAPVRAGGVKLEANKKEK